MAQVRPVYKKELFKRSSSINPCSKDPDSEQLAVVKEDHGNIKDILLGGKKGDTNEINESEKTGLNKLSKRRSSDKIMHFSNPPLSTVPEEGPTSQFNSRSHSIVSSVKIRKSSVVSVESVGPPPPPIPQVPKLKPWQMGRARPRNESETVDVKRKLGPQNIRFVYSEAVEKELRKRGISLNVGRLNGWTNQIQFQDNCNADIDQLSDIHNEAERRMRNITMKKGRWSKSPSRKLTARTQVVQVAHMPIAQAQGSKFESEQEITAPTSDPGNLAVNHNVSSYEKRQALASISSRPKSFTSLTESGCERILKRRQITSDSRTPSPDRPQRPWKLRGFSRLSAQPVDSSYNPEQLVELKMKYESRKKSDSPIIIPEPLPSVKTPQCFLTELIYRPVKELTRPQVVYKTGRIVVFTPKGKPLKDTHVIESI